MLHQIIDGLFQGDMNHPVNMEAQCSTFLQNQTIICALTFQFISPLFLRSVK